MQTHLGEEGDKDVRRELVEVRNQFVTLGRISSHKACAERKIKAQHNGW